MKLHEFLPFVGGKFKTDEPILVYNSAYGVYIYDYLYSHARELGYSERLNKHERIDWHDEILTFLNDLCEGCSFEWSDGDFWLLPDGFTFE